MIGTRACDLLKVLVIPILGVVWACPVHAASEAPVGDSKWVPSAGSDRGQGKALQGGVVNADNDTDVKGNGASPSAGQPPTASAPVRSRSLGRRLPAGITAETKDAIERGLAYLVRQQERQGSWSNRGGYGRYPVAMTALSGLALLMDGNTTTQGRYAPQVDRATRFLLRSVRGDGLIARPGQDSRPMHGHGFAMLFLSQVYGVTEDATRAREIHEALLRAVRLTAESQSARGGWMYTPGSRSDEGSVTVTQVQGLRSCRNVGIAVPKNTIDGAMEYLVKSQNSDGGIRYMASQQQGPSRPAITAAAVACWYNAGQYDNPRAKRALSFCRAKLPGGSPFRGHDYYAHLYLSQALFVGSDPAWNVYFARRRDYLLGRQNPDGSWQGDNVGDIYGTAVALIILQLPFQQLPIMQP